MDGCADREVSSRSAYGPGYFFLPFFLPFFFAMLASLRRCCVVRWRQR